MSGRDRSPVTKPASAIGRVAARSHFGSEKPAPPYRMLVVGDFGFTQTGEHHRLVDGNFADILAETGGIFVSVDNLLGSFPTTVSDTVRLSRPGDLKPHNLLRQFSHHAVASQAIAMGDLRPIEAAGQLYDRFRPEDRPNPEPDRVDPFRQRSVALKAGPRHDRDTELEALFNLVETRPSPKPTAPQPSDRVAEILMDLVSTAGSGSGSGTGAGNRARPAPPASAESQFATLLDQQARLFLSNRRLRSIVENWQGVRLLCDNMAGDYRVEVTLVQFAAQESAASIRDVLVGDGAVLRNNLFDVIVFANRKDAQGCDVRKLKAIAETAGIFDSLALATLRAEFAERPADDLARLEDPDQVLRGPVFDDFRSLATAPDSERLALFWNDVLVHPVTRTGPAYFIPAALVAAAMLVRNVAVSGWPGLMASARNRLSGFPVAPRSGVGPALSGPPVLSDPETSGGGYSTATRVDLSDEAIRGLGRMGIATLNGVRDRDSVQLMSAPLIAAASTEAVYVPKLNDQLVVVRLQQLFQDLLPEVFGGDGNALDKARRLVALSEDLSQSLSNTLTFAASPAKDDSGASVLDVTVMVSEGIAASDRFNFEIPC